MATRLPFPAPSRPPAGEPVRMLPVEQLLLDAQNPRLQLKPNASQESVLRVLYQDQRLEELMASFISNGYFHEEPLVGVPHGPRSRSYVVVEGNRRLAALKLLLNPQLSRRLRITSLPDATPAEIERLNSVPVKLYADRSEVLPYLGFRHITGVKEWDAASKARYVYQLKRDTRYPLAHIAEMIGDTYNMTERLYLGWALLVQAERELGVSQSDFYKFPFSYMYDAVRMPEIKTFLGLQRDGQHKVGIKKHRELKELITWLFGSRSHSRRPLVEKKLQLKQLSYAVSEESGLRALRRGLPLEDAYRETVGELDQLLTWLTKAGKSLDNAKGIIHRHRDSAEVGELVQNCKETVVRLERELRL